MPQIIALAALAALDYPARRSTNRSTRRGRRCFNNVTERSIRTLRNRSPGPPLGPPAGRSGNRSATWGHDRWPPGQKNGLRGGLPSPALPGSGPWGSPFSLSAVRPLSLPVATPVTRRLVRSSSLDHLADDGQAARRQGRAPRAKSPGMHGPNVVSLAQAKAAIGPRTRCPCTAFLASSSRRPAPHSPGQQRKPRGLAGWRRSCLQGPVHKIIHWRSLPPACRESNG
jgi:hypothetical protein